MEDEFDPAKTHSKGTKYLLIALVLLLAVFFIFTTNQQENRQNAVEECKERFGEDAAYDDFDGDPCFDVEPYKEKILTRLANNQPMTSDSIAQTIELGEWETYYALKALARQGEVYSYDRGWAEPGWKILDTESEADQ
jgi:hypothetical protein